MSDNKQMVENQETLATVSAEEPARETDPKQKVQDRKKVAAGRAGAAA